MRRQDHTSSPLGWVEGRAWITSTCTALLVVAVLSMVFVSRAEAVLSFAPGSPSLVARNADGTIDTRAGSHPDTLTLHAQLKIDQNGKTEGGELRNAVVDLPPGLIGDPQAVPRCPLILFERAGCPGGAQVGVLRAAFNGGGGEAFGPLYNLVPPPGVAAELAFRVLDLTSQQYATLKSETGYGVSVAALNTPIAVSSITETVWGVPAAGDHDPERFCHPTEVMTTEGCASETPARAYLTMPASCDSPPQTTVSVDTVQEPTVYASETVETLDLANNPVSMTGCDAVPFSPLFSSLPTSRAASSPSGLDFELRLPDQGLESPGGTTETEPRKTVVTLPEGVSANPAFAEGITGCSPAQYAAEKIDTPAGAGCPEASKLGSVEAQTPLLEEPIRGSVYLASPYDNPFGSLVALYIVGREQERGVLVKQAGKVEFDQQTGQIKAIFDGLPPVPYSSFKLDFREGARAPLATPQACGEYRTVGQFTPFSAKTDAEAVERTTAFQIEHGPEGGACPPGGVPPLHPGLVAGSLNNAAGRYTPLSVRITRNDAEQEITGFSSLLPAGLSANLTGVPFCSEQDITTARSKTGAQEQTEPSCPAASQIGHTLVGVGAGTVLAYTPGKLYMAGPFEGAPFSIVAITSAKVGPFDLGTVIVHLPLRIDPVTAQVSIPAGAPDQIPHIIKGVVVHVRDIRVYVDRPNFTLNPTSCQTSAFQAGVIGSGQNFTSPVDDTTAPVNNRFQAAECANLGFKPIFKANTNSKTSRKNGASLTVKLAYPKAPFGTQSNIRTVKVSLPKQLPSRLTTLQKACTATQFETNPAGCPLASRVGQATATTPILPVPLTGPAYFVSHGGAKFPELIIVLQGYGITIDLHGETFISKTGITSSTFHTIPDQPVTGFELTLPQGPDSALAANGNLCTTTLKMPTQFTGQNGASIKQSTPVNVTGCPKKKAKHTAKKATKAGHLHQNRTKKK